VSDGIEEDDSPALSTREVAGRLGLSQDKVRQMIIDGEIEAFVSKGRYRVRESEVGRYLDRQMTEPGPRSSPLDAADVVAYMARPDLADLPMLLSVNETAAFLRLPVPSVRTAIQRGHIPSVPWNSRRLVPVAQLVAMLSGIR
jgi:excisionase family DNA binding protein